MKEVKNLFDPKNLINPGVIFNDDPECHIKNFKPLPLTNAHVDKCIECGFCEVNCLTCGFTLSSRQRIVIRREISRLRKSGEDNERLAKYEWGEAAFEVMKEVKNLFDPNNLINPGVIFNDDPECHIKNFKHYSSLLLQILYL